MNSVALLGNTAAVGVRDSQDEMIALGRTEARAILGAGSKSFALAGALLGRGVRDDAAVLYAWCRLADDLIDEAPQHAQATSLGQLHEQLDVVYGDGKIFPTPLLAAMHELVHRTGIPRAYPEALIEGFVMDATGHVYQSTNDLDLYAYRVAGVVGLMMCHVMGTRDDRCLKQAVHLGMAMQFTNVCRDVAEDWRRGRLYLPRSTLRPGFALLPGDPLTQTDQDDFTRAAAFLYERAELYYRSSAEGLRGLGWRSAVAISAAMRIYRAIGRKIARRHHQVLRGRVVISTPHKTVLLLFSLVSGLVDLPRRWIENVADECNGLRTPKQRVRYEDAAIHS